MHVGGLAQKKEHEPHSQNLGSALCSLEDLGLVFGPINLNFSLYNVVWWEDSLSSSRHLVCI